MVDYRLIITCEHGGCTIPKPYRPLFKTHTSLLKSHRSYDWGALDTARFMAGQFNAPLFTADTSRLLVDLNRSIGHPRLFSKITRPLTAAEKEDLLRKHYLTHRNPIESAVRNTIDSGGTVLHIACHSFTPVLEGRVREMDVGLLYDPAREPELLLCRGWKRSMIKLNPKLKISSNAPYKGVSDGLATYLRKRFAERYLGIELELNQRTFREGKSHWRKLNAVVVQGLGRFLSVGSNPDD